MTSARKLKLCLKWGFQMDNDPKHTSKVVKNGLRITKSRYWSGHHKAYIKEAYKPDSVTPALSEGMGQNSPNLL